MPDSQEKRSHIFCQYCGAMSIDVSTYLWAHFFRDGSMSSYVPGWVCSTKHHGTHILCPEHSFLLPDYDAAQDAYDAAMDEVERKVQEREGFQFDATDFKKNARWADEDETLSDADESG